MNVGIRSTPNYADTFTKAAIHSIGNGYRVFAGQRAEGFFVDLGSIFDLGALRPFEHLHLIPSADAVGVNGTQGLNVHSIALQVPISELTDDGSVPTDVMSPGSVVGIWAGARRQKSKVFNSTTGNWETSGPWVQVSRLGNPLFNEVVVPMGDKDHWNKTAPINDSQFAKYVLKPELAGLLPVLYPGVFPNLAAYKKPRARPGGDPADRHPGGIVSGFQNYTGSTQADFLRLNMAIKPSSSPNPLGLIGGDPAGFPNGRRVADDIVSIELRAIAGVTIPLVDPSFTPDGAAGVIQDGTSNTNAPYLSKFPYLGTPASGYSTMPGVPAS